MTIRKARDLVKAWETETSEDLSRSGFDILMPKRNLSTLWHLINTDAKMDTTQFLTLQELMRTGRTSDIVSIAAYINSCK